MVGRRRHAAAAQGVGGVDEEPRDALGPGVAEHVVVPAGADDAGAVARGPAEPAVGPRHPRDGDLHLRPAAQRGRVGGRSWSTVGSRAGTCQAPHTTATTAVAGRARPRMRRRMCASRRASSGVGRRCRRGPRPSPRRRRRTPARRRRGARRGPPTTARRRARRPPRRARRAGRAAARRPPAAPGSSSPTARTTASGRSMASTATPCSAAHAHRLPLRAELGERGEHGPLRAGRRRSRAGRPAGRGRRGRSSAARRRRRPAPRRARRRAAARRAPGRTERAEPGPWWRMPSRCSRGTGRRPTAVRRGRGRRRRSRPSRRGRGPPPRGTRATRRRRAAGRGRRRRRCRRRCRWPAACRRRSGRRGPARW